MKIVIFNPQSSFSPELQKKLSSLGKVSYTKSRDELPEKKLLEMAEGVNIIGVDPDPLGGFEKVKEKLTKIMESVQNLKGGYVFPQLLSVGLIWSGAKSIKF